MKAQQFLNPKSMITPGVAGSMVMLITNALVIQFGLPGRWIALSLSFLLALVVFLTTTIPMWQRGIYYLFNALLIFSIAIGTNQVGAATARPRPPEVQAFPAKTKEDLEKEEEDSKRRDRISEIEDDLPSLQQQLLDNSEPDKDPKLKQEIRNLREELEKLRQQEHAEVMPPPQMRESKEPFFRAWFSTDT
jgi:hypothetical protein